MREIRTTFLPAFGPTFQRRIVGNGDGTLVESKCRACGQMVDTMMDQSPERGDL